MGKIFNKPPPWNPRILRNLRRFICVGTVSKEGRKMSEKWKIKRVKNALQWPLVVKVHEVSNKNGKILDVMDCALDRILAWCYHTSAVICWSSAFKIEEQCLLSLSSLTFLPFLPLLDRLLFSCSLLVLHRITGLFISIKKQLTSVIVDLVF